MQVDQAAAARNSQLAQTAAVQAATGLGCALFAAFILFVVFLIIGFDWVGYRGAMSFALGCTAFYLGVATWSALRDVDPLAGLSPLTSKEQAHRMVEDAFSDQLGGGGLKGLRREGIAGMGNFLVAGPRNLVGAWRSWRRRVPTDPALLARAQALLDRAANGSVEVDDPVAALLLVHVGLARIERGDDGPVLRARARA